MAGKVIITYVWRRIEYASETLAVHPPTNSINGLVGN